MIAARLHEQRNEGFSPISSVRNIRGTGLECPMHVGRLNANPADRQRGWLCATIYVGSVILDRGNSKYGDELKPVYPIIRTCSKT